MKSKFGISVKIAMFMVLLIFSLVNVKAFGVTSPYWKERPLEMAPGETQIVTLLLQNMVGTENVRVRAEIINGSEIAEIIDPNKEYYVPLGTKNVTVNLRITIPSSAPEGKEYIVGVAFTTIKEGTGGGVVTGTGIEKYFPVVVKTPTRPTAPKVSEKKLPIWIVVVIIIAIVLFIIWLLIRKKKEIKKK